MHSHDRLMNELMNKIPRAPSTVGGVGQVNQPDYKRNGGGSSIGSPNLNLHQAVTQREIANRELGKGPLIKPINMPNHSPSSSSSSGSSPVHPSITKILSPITKLNPVVHDSAKAQQLEHQGIAPFHNYAVATPYGTNRVVSNPYGNGTIINNIYNTPQSSRTRGMTAGRTRAPKGGVSGPVLVAVPRVRRSRRATYDSRASAIDPEHIIPNTRNNVNNDCEYRINPETGETRICNCKNGKKCPKKWLSYPTVRVAGGFEGKGSAGIDDRLI